MLVALLRIAGLVLKLSSARLADRIVVLEEGRIVETGSHEELMERRGRYHELFSLQAQWYR